MNETKYPLSQITRKAHEIKYLMNRVEYWAVLFRELGNNKVADTLLEISFDVKEKADEISLLVGQELDDSLAKSQQLLHSVVVGTLSQLCKEEQ